MALTYLNSSTLSAALNKTDNTFTVGSTANISVGSLLLFPGEIMKVQDIPVSGRVSVRRGYEGTHAAALPSGATFYIGSPDDVKRLRDNAIGILGDAGKVPDICIPGARGVDARGYEYILVDCTATIVPYATVLISKDGLYTASVLSASGQGNVGVLQEDATSNQWAWALIRGLTTVKLVTGSSLMTSTGVFAASTFVSTPSVGLLGQTTSQFATTVLPVGFLIHRMWPAQATTTGTTAATSHTGLQAKAWLEYPYINRRISS